MSLSKDTKIGCLRVMFWLPLFYHAQMVNCICTLGTCIYMTATKTWSISCSELTSTICIVCCAEKTVSWVYFRKSVGYKMMINLCSGNQTDQLSSIFFQSDHVSTSSTGEGGIGGIPPLEALTQHFLPVRRTNDPNQPFFTFLKKNLPPPSNRILPPWCPPPKKKQKQKQNKTK